MKKIMSISNNEIKLVSITKNSYISKGKVYSGYESYDGFFVIERNDGGFKHINRELFLTQKEYRKIRLKNLLETI